MLVYKHKGKRSILVPVTNTIAHLQLGTSIGNNDLSNN